MNFTLERQEFRPDGIFGRILDEQGNEVCKTLEHAYSDGVTWRAKLPVGDYDLTKGTHSLSNGVPFQAYCFPIFTGWDGNPHTNILIHKGNLDQDSEGCILVGTVFGDLGQEYGILNSGIAFSRFMSLAQDDTITMHVREP